MTTPSSEGSPPATGSERQTSGDAEAQLAATISAMAEAVAADAIHPKAVVIMPSEEDLQVQLVRLDEVLHLEESAADESIIAGVGYTLIGSLLGILVNLVTANASAVTAATRVAIVANILFIALVGVFWRRLRNRAKQQRAKLHLTSHHVQPSVHAPSGSVNLS